MTKTYKYLFIPSSILFFSSKIQEAFNEIDIDDVYLWDKDFKMKPDDGYFFIVAHLNNKFYKKINSVTESSFFVCFYTIGTEYVVIVMRCLKGSSWQNFLKSEYSKMFSKEVLELAHIKIKFTKNPILEDIFHVLTRDEGLRKKLASRFLLDISEVVELDEKIDMQKEMFDKNNTFYSCKKK